MILESAWSERLRIVAVAQEFIAAHRYSVLEEGTPRQIGCLLHKRSEDARWKAEAE